MDRDSILLRMIRAAQMVDNRIDSVLVQVDLSRAKLALLHHIINANEPIALSKLASKQSCVKSNITNLVDRMQSEGLVERVDDDNDRRSVRVRATEQGQRLYEHGIELVAQEEQQLLKRIGIDDRDQFAQMLLRFEQAGVSYDL